MPHNTLSHTPFCRGGGLLYKGWGLLVANEAALQAFALFGLLLLYMWLVDGPDRLLLSHQGKQYSRDFFVFLLLVVLICGFSSIESFNPRMIAKTYFSIPCLWASPLPPSLPVTVRDEETGEKG